MKKVIGIQAEVNITADEDIVKGIGKGTIKLGSLFDELKSTIAEAIKKEINK